MIPQPILNKPKKKGRLQSISIFIRETAIIKELSPSERLVWLIMVDSFQKATKTVTIGVELLSKRTGLCKRTVVTVLKSLREKELVIQLERGNNLNWKPSTYKVRIK